MINLPRTRIAHLPTPIEHLSRLSAELGGPKILVKRDDQTGLAFGGNKTRKLEYLIADAQAHGAHTLLTAGALQSNHCRQTAAAAARYGFDCILVLVDGENSDIEAQGLDTSTAQSESLSGNLLLDTLFDAEIVKTSSDQRDEILQSTFQDAWENGRRPYLIPYGGSNPVGAAGYVSAMQELVAQDVDPDWIVFASSSGGTQAGLMVGARMVSYANNILGISVDEPASVLRERIAKLASETAEYIGETYSFNADDVQVNSDYVGEGYGVAGQPEKEAIKLFAQKEGLLLDPVYTGRAAAGMMDLIRRGFFKDEHTILFWHTGGTPALFSDRYKDLF